MSEPMTAEEYITYLERMLREEMLKALGQIVEAATMTKLQMERLPDWPPHTSEIEVHARRLGELRNKLDAVRGVGATVLAKGAKATGFDRDRDGNPTFQGGGQDGNES